MAALVLWMLDVPVLLYGMTRRLYAHTPPLGGTEWHELVDHLVEVARMAREFAEPFGGGDLAYMVGLWHDVGKSSPDFQAYLQRCFADPLRKGRGPDHKAAGVALALDFFPYLALLVQGHHGGLRDREDMHAWFARRRNDRTADGTMAALDAARATMRAVLPAIEPVGKLPYPDFVRRDPRSAEFFLRMLFSALVDADFLDTERHRNEGHAVVRGCGVSMGALWLRFVANQEQLVSVCSAAVLEARQTMYAACVAAAEQPPGLFRLAVPTGGGKTRSAMAFALRHALAHGQIRVVVAVPYISITEQTAQEYRAIFEVGEDEDVSPVVLEHHSGAAVRRSDADEYDAGALWARLAAENWDAPVVVTTTVQLFESLFANQTSRCRKLHRLARSVIILDEVQALPTTLLSPILDGVRELCEHYGTTVVLSTATQPAFACIPAFANVRACDIVPDAARWFTALKRVDYEWRIDRTMGWDEVAEEMWDAEQVLTVVNTKRDALVLLDALGEDPSVLHLSTLLCGAHRRAVIAEVKRRLVCGELCRLVSTQVIEAGVDVDFPRVLRAMGPLDRVIQAAGRCNRGGNLVCGQVVVFEPTEGAVPRGHYEIATNTTRTLLGDGAVDPDAPDDVGRYFRVFFDRLSHDTDREGIQGLREKLKYVEVAERFRMVDQATMDVVVYYGDEDTVAQVGGWVERLRHKPPEGRSLLRRLQPFVVSVPVYQADLYVRSGLIELLADFDGLGVWHGRYDDVRGLGDDIDRELLTSV